MTNKFDTILQETLKNDRVAKKVDALKLTKEQMIDALPILIDMANEIEDGISKTLTSFEVLESGSVKRIAVLSKRGIELSYINNIVTQKINPINFEENKEFSKEEGRKEVVNLFAKHLNKETCPGKGLYLYGEMGIGKTFLMKRFAKMLAEAGNKVAFVNLSSLTSIIKSTFSKGNEEYFEIQNLLSRVNYLFIDDIGAEKVTSWFRDDFLFPLLNERMEHKKITFFSSNYSHDKLAKKQSITTGTTYKDYYNSNRLMSRIKALSKEVKIQGTNKRY